MEAGRTESRSRLETRSQSVSAAVALAAISPRARVSGLLPEPHKARRKRSAGAVMFRVHVSTSVRGTLPLEPPYAQSLEFLEGDPICCASLPGRQFAAKPDLEDDGLVEHFRALPVVQIGRCPDGSGTRPKGVARCTQRRLARLFTLFSPNTTLVVAPPAIRLSVGVLLRGGLQVGARRGRRAGRFASGVVVLPVLSTQVMGKLVRKFARLAV